MSLRVLHVLREPLHLVLAATQVQLSCSCRPETSCSVRIMSSFSLVFSYFLCVFPNPCQYLFFFRATLHLVLTAIFIQFETLFVPSVSSSASLLFHVHVPDLWLLMLCSLEVVVLDEYLGVLKLPLTLEVLHQVFSRQIVLDRVPVWPVE